MPISTGQQMISQQLVTLSDHLENDTVLWDKEQVLAYVKGYLRGLVEGIREGRFEGWQ